MTPSNPNNQQPLIYRIADALGITHLVVAVQHSHLMSEIEGLVSALAGKSDTSHSHKIIQYNPSASTDGFAGFPTTGNGDFVVGVQDNKNIIFQFGGIPKASFTKTNSDNLARALQTPDSTPTENSDNLVTSGGVKAALDDKQDALTFDSTPTAGSTNPVTSGGVKEALDGKQDTLTFDTTPTANSTNPVTSGGVNAALDGKAPKGDTEVIFEEGENLFVYLPYCFENGERQRSFILNYQGEQTELINLFGCSTHDMIRILSHDDSTIMVGECYIAVRVIKQPSGVEQGDVYYIIFDGKNDY